MAFFASIDGRTARHFHRGRREVPSVLTEPPEGPVPALRKGICHGAQSYGIHRGRLQKIGRKEPTI